MSGRAWRRRLRARVSLHDLAQAGEQLADDADAVLRTEKARAALLEGIDEALAAGASEAEIDVELGAYRAEAFDVHAFVADVTLIARSRELRHPEVGRGWATVGEVARRAGVGEALVRDRYIEALRLGLVHDIDPPAAADVHEPAFAASPAIT